MKKQMKAFGFILLAAFIILTGCNLDGNGIFNDISESQTSMDVTLVKLLGYHLGTDSVYALSNKGLVKATGTTITEIESSARMAIRRKNPALSFYYWESVPGETTLTAKILETPTGTTSTTSHFKGFNMSERVFTGDSSILFKKDNTITWLYDPGNAPNSLTIPPPVGDGFELYQFIDVANKQACFIAMKNDTDTYFYVADVAGIQGEIEFPEDFEYAKAFQLTDDNEFLIIDNKGRIYINPLPGAVNTYIVDDNGDAIIASPLTTSIQGVAPSIYARTGTTGFFIFRATNGVGVITISGGTPTYNLVKTGFAQPFTTSKIVSFMTLSNDAFVVATEKSGIYTVIRYFNDDYSNWTVEAGIDYTAP